MKKLLVETTGAFMLVDYSDGGTEINAFRPSVVRNTQFVQSRVSTGDLTVLGTVTDAATDEAFADTLRNSKDTTMAVEAFLAEFDPKPAPAPAPKTTRKAK